MTRIAGWCVLLALAVRAPLVFGDLESDESGLLLVVRGWDPSTTALYGDYWVDRPPILLGYFWLADLLPGVTGVRLLGCVVCAVLVVAAVLAGWLLNGRAGAWAAGLVAASLGSTFIIGGHMMNGMAQGVALIMAACCAAVAATVGSPGRARLHGLSALSGVLGASAALVKQNLVDGLVFAVVVLAMSWLTRELSTRRVVAATASLLGGVALVVGAVIVWALAAGVDLGLLWYALYEFRLDAAHTISAASMDAPLRRAGMLVLWFVVSGLALVVAVFVAAVPGLVRDPARRKYVAGVVGLAAVAAVGIVGGGSWWSHYLLQLVPAASLMAAIVVPAAPRTRPPRERPRPARSPMQVAVALTVLSAVVTTVISAVTDRVNADQVAVGRYLGEAAQPGDTALVAYGSAEVLLYSGLHSRYPHLWSLPMRVNDPDLEGMRSELEGSRAPTWIVQLGSLNAWGIDADGELAADIERRYRLVATPCGYRIYLLRQVQRTLPTDEPCA